jgi:hypothetical protein
VGYGQPAENSGYCIPFAVITVATPAQATLLGYFTLRLRGPFGCSVQAGFHQFPLSGLPVCSVLVLFNAFFGSVWLDYRRGLRIVKFLMHQHVLRHNLPGSLIHPLPGAHPSLPEGVRDLPV